MSTASVLQAAAPLVVAGVGTPIVLGGFHWLRAVSRAVSTLATVTEQLGAVTDAQATLAREMRHLRRELALHVRECEHGTPGTPREPWGGPDRRRVPRPRTVIVAADEMTEAGS
jgi:hypothetical protein